MPEICEFTRRRSRSIARCQGAALKPRRANQSTEVLAAGCALNGVELPFGIEQRPCRPGDAIDRMPQTSDKAIYLKQQLKDKLYEHRQYINKHGEDLPEIRNWKWGNPK
jgi:hypothetical protein